MLIGRSDEQRAIDALLAGARLGQSGVLVLRGEAGIGKSALLDHAVRRSQGLRILRTTGTETERDLPFAGLAQLLRPVADDVARLPPHQADALAVALGWRPGTRPDRFAVSAAVLGLVTTVAEDGPIGLVVDDGHLVDRPSAEAIAFTCRRLLADPVFALVAVRGVAGDPVWSADLPQRTLTGLDGAAAADLVAAAAPMPVDRHLSRVAVDLAQGNPLALRELARDPERLRSFVPGVPVPVPTVVADAYSHRAAGLDEADRPILLVVAVAEGALPVVQRVGDALALDRNALERAESLGLVRLAEDRAEFPHPLARSAAYASASPAQRRQVHRLVAEALPVGEADRRAWHACEAVVGPDPAVADDLERVGDRAAGRGAHAVAATAYERAARLSVRDRERSRRFLLAGEAAWLAGDDARALDLLAEVPRHDASPGLEARALATAGRVAARAGSLRAARDQLLAAALTMEDLDRDEALMMYADAVDVCFYLLDVPTAAEAAGRIEALLGRAEPGEVPGGPAAAASIALGMVRVFIGKSGVDQIRAGVAGIAADDFTEPGVQSAWEVLGPLFLRESGTGRHLVTQALAQRREAAAIGTLPHLLYHLARDDATTDRWSRAAAGYGEAISLARELGQVNELGVSLAGLTWLTARQGRVAEARALAAETEEAAAAHDSLLAAAWVRFAVAELDLSLGEVDAATAALTSLSEWLDTLGVLDADLSPVPELVEAMCRTGRRTDAPAVASAYLERAADKGQPWSLARAARVRGLLAPPDGFEPCFTEALAWHDRTLDGFETARTHLVFGERLRRARRRVDARVQLRGALEIFERLGAQRWADVALAELDATGLTSQRGETGSVVGLTARELQICQLVVEGRTTRETAAAVFLSPKTVEYHLRHVYLKLGIGSRAELAEKMGRG